MKEYEQIKALRLLAEAIELMVDDMRPEVKSFNGNVETLASYLRYHGDQAVKDVIHQLWG